MVIGFYELELENDRLLNPLPFIKFCIDNQHQDVVIQVNNEGHCLRFTGIYDILDMFRFNSVTLKTWNKLEKHDKYTIDHTKWDHWLTRTDGYDLEFDYTWTGDKIFGCFYGRPSAPRLGIAAYLHLYYRDKSLIKIKFSDATEDTRKLFDLERLYSWDSKLIKNIPDLILTYNNDSDYIKGKWQTENPINYLYKDIFIDLVSEPVCKGISFYPTEKITRPLLFKKPFIVMASKNYLIYLRQLGFKTFHDFWDEDYDGYDGKERYQRILQLIDTLSKTDIVSISNDKKFNDILIHNRYILLNHLYSKDIHCVN